MAESNSNKSGNLSSGLEGLNLGSLGAIPKNKTLKGNATASKKKTSSGSKTALEQFLDFPDPPPSDDEIEKSQVKPLAVVSETTTVAAADPSPTPGTRRRKNRRQRRRRTLEDNRPSDAGAKHEEDVEDVAQPVEDCLAASSDLDRLLNSKDLRVPELPSFEDLAAIPKLAPSPTPGSKPEQGALATPVMSRRQGGGRRRRGKRKKQRTPEEVKTSATVASVKKEEEEEDDDDESGPSEYIWRNVIRSGAVKKCVLVEGVPGGGRPKSGDTVLVKSQGKLKDGTIIDDFPTLVFNVGEYEVIEGLDLAVRSMNKNELSILSVKPELAYGQLGRKNDVPSSNECVIYAMPVKTR